jgi:hypothetical protein
MKYRSLGKSGAQVSELSFGAWVTFGKQADIDLAADLRIPMKMDTDSNRWWTLVPIDDGHLFQSMVISGTG